MISDYTGLAGRFEKIVESEYLGKRKSLVGRRFEMLTVSKFVGFVVIKCGHKGTSLWICICDCGKEIISRQDKLVNGCRKTCGCGEGVEGFLKRMQEKTKLAKNGCLEWTGCKDKKGYGKTRVSGKNTLVHRQVFILANGPIQDGLFVCHKCDNPCCVSLGHLFLGTNQDNVRDAVNKNRTIFGSRCAWSKLNDDSAREIYVQYHNMGVTVPKLAIMFGVADATIWGVVNRTSWRRATDLLAT